MMTKESGSFKKFEKKKKNKNKIKTRLQQVDNATQGMVGVRQTLRLHNKLKNLKEKCFRYFHKGHRKLQCHLLKEKVDISYSIIVESCLEVQTTNIRCVDFRVTYHVCNLL